jgi:predicted  nucleic acid-binding Zn-ribbon protein
MPEDTRRAQLEAELRDAKERVAQGERDIAHLAVMVARLEAQGAADQTAPKALEALRRSQVLFVDERDRLRRVLGR